MSGQAIWAIARADFLERTRRYGFFVTLLFAVFLGYQTAVGHLFMQLDSYRGVYTSGWIGALMAMVITLFVSLSGFYIVKSGVQRDRETGVGAILAATPLSRPAYALGKWLSNFAVLAAIVAVLALAALVMQFVAAEDTHVNLWALLSPFLLVALPAMALTAAAALCFEILPGLRGGIGNVVWFFVWTFALSLPVAKENSPLDPLGMITVMRALTAEAKKYIPGYKGGIAFQIDVGHHAQVAQDFRWAGIAWTWESALGRLAWIAVAAILVAAVSQLFDRFDGAQAGRARRAPAAPAPPALNSPARGLPAIPAAHAMKLAEVAPGSSFPAFAQMVVAELRLALKGYGWWWYAVALGLLIAQIASPLSATGVVLGVAWVWPVLVWSGLGTREKTRGTQQVVFSCPEILARQFPAAWIAGILVALLCGAGAGVKLALAGDLHGLSGWLAGAIFVPSLALFLGVWSGTSKFFEGLYMALWYVGPMHHTPRIDFTGSASGANAVRYALLYFALSAALFVMAWLRRRVQINGLR
ncbi:MAG TPA: hypothetical protein VMT51_04230 [Dongiaceae bacterium]|nr:hypothetical protein [Dongiaceae bacterium]